MLELVLLTVATAVVIREVRRLEEKHDRKNEIGFTKPNGPGSPDMDTDHPLAEETKGT